MMCIQSIINRKLISNGNWTWCSTIQEAIAQENSKLLEQGLLSLFLWQKSTLGLKNNFLSIYLCISRNNNVCFDSQQNFILKNSLEKWN